MPFNPSLPANNSPISSSELRDQLNGLNDAINACVTHDGLSDEIQTTVAWEGTARNLDLSIGRLDMAVSDPPTQAQVQAIADKMDELIDALRRP